MKSDGMSDEVFALTDGERNSALWLKLLNHFTNKLSIARGKNDGPHDEVTTAMIRGQIAVYRALIELDKDSQ